MIPVNAQSQAPPERFKAVFSLVRDFQARPDEGFTPYLCRFTLDGLLNKSFRCQPIVVKAHRVEDAVPTHSAVTSNHIRLYVGIAVPDVQLTRDGRRRRVDGEDAV